MRFSIWIIATVLASFTVNGGPASTADTSGGVTQLEALLRRWAQVPLGKDLGAELEFAKNFLSDDYEAITGHGKHLRREAFLESVGAESPYLSNQTLERKVRMNGNTAIATELSEIELKQHGKFQVWTTLVMLKKQGQWKLCFSQTTPVQ